ncbi:RDD family protein [Verrucomicrobiaceae bacterium 227]
MKFWIHRDGKKHGPIEDYELRAMIRDGEVKDETLVWFEDADGWTKASEVALLSGEFLVEEIEPPPLPPPVTPFLMWRRLGARWFDFLLYQLLLLIVFRAGGMAFLSNPDVPQSGMAIIGLLLPVIIMEGALLGSIGYTPGKWLMGLKVTNSEGGLLSTGQATMRSLRVWVLGMGMRNGLLIIFGHLFNLWVVKKRGVPLWDVASGFRVPGRDLSTQRILTFWILAGALFSIFWILLWPELQPFVEAEMARQGK